MKNIIPEIAHKLKKTNSKLKVNEEAVSNGNDNEEKYQAWFLTKEIEKKLRKDLKAQARKMIESEKNKLLVQQE